MLNDGDDKGKLSQMKWKQRISNNNVSTSVNDIKFAIIY